MSRAVIGVRLYIGPNLCGDVDFEYFLKRATMDVDNLDVGPDNSSTCVYYDEFPLGGDNDDSGHIYFHFDRPVDREILAPFLEDEIIYQIEE